MFVCQSPLFSLSLSLILALDCYTNETEGICSSQLDWAHCRVYVQKGQAYQVCDLSLLHSYDCVEELLSSPDDIVSYMYCCQSDLCNSIQKLYQLIAEQATPTSSLPVTSHLSLSQTPSLTSTLLSSSSWLPTTSTIETTVSNSSPSPSLLLSSSSVIVSSTYSSIYQSTSTHTGSKYYCVIIILRFNDIC